MSRTDFIAPPSLSRDYNSDTLHKELRRFANAINKLSRNQGELDEVVRREIFGIKKKDLPNTLATAEVVFWVDWYHDDATDEDVGRMIFASGWGKVRDVQYRVAASRNADTSDTWIGLNDGADISFVEYTGAEPDEYPQGGYYEWRQASPAFSEKEKNHTYQVQIRAIDRRADVVAFSSAMFDTNKLPDIINAAISVGEWTGTQWTLSVSGQADLDSLSVSFAVRSTIGDIEAMLASGNPHTSVVFNTLTHDLFTGDVFTVGTEEFTVGADASAGSEVTVTVSSKSLSGDITEGATAYADWSIDDNLVDADFDDGTKVLSGTDRRFTQSLGLFDPDINVWVVARSYDDTSGAGGTGTGSNPPYWRQRVALPPAPFSITDIGTGDITASMIADDAKRTNIKLEAQWKSGDEDNTIQYKGTIDYGGGTIYYMGGSPGTSWQDLTPSSTGFYYIFFDPTTWAGEGSGTATEDLQLTTDLAVAGAQSGKRRLIGTMSKAPIKGQRAFYVIPETGQITITAAYVYALSLASITARLGRVTVGWLEGPGGIQIGPDVFYESIGTVDQIDAGQVTEIVFQTLSEDLADGDHIKVSNYSFVVSGAHSAGSSVTVTLADENHVNATINAGTSASRSVGGVYIDANNYWYETGEFKIGGASAYVKWDNVNLTVQGAGGIVVPWSDVTSKPTRLDDTPVGSGLYLSSDHVGFYSGSAWTAYIRNDGTFLFSAGATNYFKYDGVDFELLTAGAGLKIGAGGITSIWDSTTFGSGTVFNSWLLQEGAQERTLGQRYTYAGLGYVRRWFEDIAYGGPRIITAAIDALCSVDGAQSGTLTSIDVLGLVEDLSSGDKMWLDDGTEIVVAPAGASAGDTSIPIVSQSLTLTNGESLYLDETAGADGESAVLTIQPTHYTAPGGVSIWSYLLPLLSFNGDIEADGMFAGATGVNFVSCDLGSSVVNSTTETDMIGRTMEVDRMKAGSVLRIRLVGAYSSSGTNTVTLRGVVDGVTVATKAISLASGSGVWIAHLDFTFNGSTGGLSGDLYFEGGNGSGVKNFLISGSGAVTVSGTYEIKLTAQWTSANAGDDIGGGNSQSLLLNPKVR